MEVKTTADVYDIEIPECPDELMEKMVNENIPPDGTICRKCKWDSLCNEKWVRLDGLKAHIKERKNLIALQIAGLEDGVEMGEGKHPHLIEYGSQRLNELKKLEEKLNTKNPTNKNDDNN